jgi:hypothetical protein
MEDTDKKQINGKIRLKFCSVVKEASKGLEE